MVLEIHNYNVMVLEIHNYNVNEEEIKTAKDMRKWLLQLAQEFKDMSSFDIKGPGKKSINTFRQFLTAIFKVGNNNHKIAVNEVCLTFNGNGLVQGARLLNVNKLKFNFSSVYKRIVKYELLVRTRQGRKICFNDLLKELFNFKLKQELLKKI